MPPPLLRYRKVYVHVWADEKFCALPSNAKFLWLYLLTAPETTSLPGLFRAHPALIADALGWAADDVRPALALIEAAGMARVDWEKHVVYIPQAYEYDPPDNPNVVKSWRSHIAVLPKRPIVIDALEEIGKRVSRRSREFAIAFREARGALRGEDSSEKQTQLLQGASDTPAALIGANGIGNSQPNGIGNGMRNQEQEQEQDLRSFSSPSEPDARAGVRFSQPDSHGELGLRLQRERERSDAIDAEFVASGYGSRLAWMDDKAKGTLKTGDAAVRRVWSAGRGAFDPPETEPAAPRAT